VDDAAREIRFFTTSSHMHAAKQYLGQATLTEKTLVEFGAHFIFKQY
jgi:hypothetical protein